MKYNCKKYANKTNIDMNTFSNDVYLPDNKCLTFKIIGMMTLKTDCVF